MQICDLTSANFGAATSLWIKAGLTRPWNPPELDLQRALDGVTSKVLGAFDVDGRLVGTVMVGHDGHREWVYYLAVDETQRGTGLGRQLMTAAENWLRDHGAVKVQLMVRSTNEAVLGFYEHLGYADSDVQVRAKRLT
ncbi:GNAT family acetyltransferase [Cryobacterium sp. TMT2-15-1]|uniref:GNAT family acetyltransferase n=1 Tax=Cryobacterium sp. TMT2-15-1 TaxID=1259246 RepID=UPI00106B61F6|nr:GNAT family acetyltransferase [Cryobacterium sp. TMT2-15-1]TFC54078.1 GNAT family acetyltransferase [Cryobacterium sp. TMT2-15-1]